MYTPYGYPIGYGPQGPQSTQFGQFMPGAMNNPPTFPNASAQTTSMPTLLQVANIKQVEQAPVQPGGKALVLVANAPVIAMRSADNKGITSTDYYRIEKFDPDETAPVPNDEYITRTEFQQAVEKIKALIPKNTHGASEREAVKK